MESIVRIEHSHLIIGEYFSVSLERTLRIPDDDKSYPLPPSLGQFPLYKVKDYLDRVPEEWKALGGYFIPMYQREAMWLRFSLGLGGNWRHWAVKVGIGKVNAVSGKTWDDKSLISDPQDYMVCPHQPWLDGINSGDGFIKQFVAMPLGMGYTVESQITGEEKHGGVQIVVFDAKPGKFPDAPPSVIHDGSRGISFGPSYGGGLESMTKGVFMSAAPPSFSMGHQGTQGSIGSQGIASVMGLGAGGRMKQKIYTDDYGVGTWNLDSSQSLYIHLANSVLFEQITGVKAPVSPVDAQTYTKHGYPWFDLYDEHLTDVQAPDVLSKIKSVTAMDIEKGIHDTVDPSIEVPNEQVVTYHKTSTGLHK